MEVFAARLRTLRKNADMTQDDLAKRIGIHKQTISQYERGVRRPDLETLAALADVLNVSADYLVGNESHSQALLSEDEIYIIDALRNDAAMKDMVLRMLEYTKTVKKGGRNA